MPLFSRTFPAHTGFEILNIPVFQAVAPPWSCVCCATAPCVNRSEMNNNATLFAINCVVLFMILPFLSAVCNLTKRTLSDRLYCAVTVRELLPFPAAPS